MLVVAAALVRDDGHILLQKRPEGREMAGLWEFPGGKLEAGEQPEAALARELAEELAIVAEPADLVPACFASASIGERDLLLCSMSAGRGRACLSRWRGRSWDGSASIRCTACRCPPPTCR